MAFLCSLPGVVETLCMENIELNTPLDLARASNDEGMAKVIERELKRGSWARQPWRAPMDEDEEY